MKRVFLIDGTGLVFRAYFAFIKKPLTTTRGENTSALFGFFKILIQILRDFKPDGMVIAFDHSRETFRREIFADYKIHREETPPDLKSQFPIIFEALSKMGISQSQVAGYEADDIIGTLVNRYQGKHEVYIVSSDKDLLQLLGTGVYALRPQKGITEINVVDQTQIKEIIGVEAKQIVDFLALVGDKSDNIPGVRGIGEKGASALLLEYGTLDNIYANIEKIKGATQLKLIEGKDSAYLSRQLASIKCDMELEDQALLGQPVTKQMLNPSVVDLFKHYQLQSIIGDLKALVGEAPAEATYQEDSLFGGNLPEVAPKVTKLGDYRTIIRKSELDILIESIQNAKLVSIDTETTSPNPLDCQIIGISVSLTPKTGFFIPLLYPAGQDFTPEYALSAFQPLLEDDAVQKIGQNIKYEIQVFQGVGISMRGIYFDTMLAAYLLNPTRTHNKLEALAEEYLGYRKADYKEVLKDVLKRDKTLLDVGIEELTDYACGDSDTALRLYHHLQPFIESAGLSRVFYEIEMPLVNVLAQMEISGILLDTGALNQLSQELAVEIVRLEKRIYELAGHSFNINSPIQLSKILFEELKLGVVRKTESGKASTDEDVLKVLSSIHPLPAEILKYRTYSKLKSTYTDSLPTMVLPKTNRIHTSFNQTIAATGRLSSSDPNLQNIPIRDELGKRIRSAFIAQDGFVLVSADYSQIELRILAHFCGDQTMKRAFSENADIHTHTASLIYHLREKEVSEEMRRKAKSVNYGIVYGLQPYGLSQQLGIPMSEAKEFIENYFHSFPSVRGFIEEILNGVVESGEVRTLSGRYRKFPDLIGKPIKSIEHLSQSQRMALNTRIQGTAADIMKIAMINVYNRLTERRLKSRLLLQIHDELVVETHQSELDTVKTILKTEMENSVALTIPIIVDIGVGRSWADAH